MTGTGIIKATRRLAALLLAALAQGGGIPAALQTEGAADDLSVKNFASDAVLSYKGSRDQPAGLPLEK